MQNVFWESLTGQKYTQNDPKVNYLYRRIGCVFNDRSFYANSQEADTAFKTSLNLEDPSKWKDMGDLSAYRVPTNGLGKLSFQSDQNIALEEEESMEDSLKARIKQTREAKKYFTRFNDDLSHLLSSALHSYEMNKVAGVNPPSDMFQAGIKNLIPNGHVFKAFPIQFVHKNVEAMFETIRLNPVGEEILNVIGDQINYSVRVKVVSYPEEVFSVWVMIGVHYVDV